MNLPRENADTPILIISSRTGKEDKLNGFDLGADDYIEKPYDIDILIAKIKGIFKLRYQRDMLSADGVTLNLADKTAVIDGKSVELPAKEFDLLALLIENQGKVLKKEYLFGAVWGSGSDSELQTLHVHINRLRQKLGDGPKNAKRLLTVWGVSGAEDGELYTSDEHYLIIEADGMLYRVEYIVGNGQYGIAAVNCVLGVLFLLVTALHEPVVTKGL